MTLGLELPETSPEAARGSSAAFCQFIHAPACIWGLPAFPPEEGGLSQEKTVRRDPTYTATDWVTG
jgi:hypothetical protein